MDGAIAALTLRDAVAFLDTPFSVLLEDKVSDRAFLLAMATPEQRCWLEERERKGWMRFEHGGGLSSMRRDIEAYKKQEFPMARVFALFDSDALRPGVPSTESDDVRRCCERPPQLEHHQLARRASENYLPREILAKHVEKQHSRREIRVAVFRAFERLRDAQRFHYNMKKGLRKDHRNPSADAGDLYADVAAEDREALMDGFGPDVGALFDSERIAEHLLQSDGGWAEMNPIVCNIIAMMR